MNKRERYLKALKNEEMDAIVWSPNLDYWLHVNRNQGTLPEKYRDLPRNDIIRAIDAYIWCRVPGYKTIIDKSVKETDFEKDGETIKIFETPIGSIRQVHTKTESEHSSRICREHFVKDIETLNILKYVVEATHYEADYEPVNTALAEVGDDGIVLHQVLCIPFIQFSKRDVGYLNAFYMWMDYREEVDSYLNVVFKNFLQAFGILAHGPADVVSTGDDMDGAMISPDIFKEYAIPFYQEVKKVMSARGKIFEGHWCGRTQNLLHMVPESGLDIVEAIVTKPMADIELGKALDLLKGQVVLKGGIPAVLVCDEGGTREDFEKYIRDVILPLKGRKGFILGMGDNIPPNADFRRIEDVAGLIK